MCRKRFATLKASEIVPCAKSCVLATELCNTRLDEADLRMHPDQRTRLHGKVNIEKNNNGPSNPCVHVQARTALNHTKKFVNQGWFENISSRRTESSVNQFLQISDG